MLYNLNMLENVLIWHTVYSIYWNCCKCEALFISRSVYLCPFFSDHVGLCGCQTNECQRVCVIKIKVDHLQKCYYRQHTYKKTSSPETDEFVSSSEQIELLTDGFFAVNPLLSKWCNATFLWICSDKETHVHIRWPEGEINFHLIFICGRIIKNRANHSC